MSINNKRKMVSLNGLSRRQLLKASAASTLVLGLPWVWRQADAQERTIVVRDPGGPYAQAFAEAFYKPFKQATGINVAGVLGTPEPTAFIKGMVDTKTYTWDVSLLSQAAADQLVQDGNYLEKLDIDNHPDVAQIPPEYKSPYLVGNNVFALGMCYRTEAFKGRRPPRTWGDFWNTSEFPGRRVLRKFPFDTIEEALLADGVAPAQLYPCDINRAFRSLDKIKKNVELWWTGPAQAIQWLKDGEADIASASFGRVQAAIDDGVPLTISWDYSFRYAEGWAIPRGNPKADMGREFIKFAANAERQAAYTKIYLVGPTNPGAYKHIDEKRAAMLPTSLKNLQHSILADVKYWAANKDAVLERFNAWVIS